MSYSNYSSTKKLKSQAWLNFPLNYVPQYSDKKTLVEVVDKIKSYDPLVKEEPILKLISILSSAEAGEKFVLQLGSCAETFASINKFELKEYVKFVNLMALMLEKQLGIQVVKLGRIAGQFAKPRSEEFETRGNLTLPSYYGDIANSFEFDLKSRTPDPHRMLIAYEKAKEAMHEINLLDDEIFFSHEALNLHYEDALTREYSGKYYNTSAHSVWIGNKTNSCMHAHVQYAAELSNPIGVKIDHTVTVSRLIELCEKLNPLNQTGKLMLIVRMGAANIAQYLPPLVKEICNHKKNLLWILDPMHGNNLYQDGVKTRNIADILAESVQFFKIMSEFKIKGLGLHLEASPFEVTEIMDGNKLESTQDLLQNYQTYCDPRLSKSQALEYIRKLKI